MTQVKSQFFSFYPYLLGLFLLFLSISGIQSKAQDKSSNPQAIKKAEEILNLSRKAIKGKNETVKITGLSTVFSLKSHFLFTKNDKETNSSERSGERQIDLSLPDKVKFSESVGDEDGTSFYNFILNGDNYDSDTYDIFKGKKSSSNVEQTDEQKKLQILEVKKQNFLRVFPVILETASNTPLEFNYIGKAESNGDKADVLETVMPDGSKLRLFFDEKSHLLRMLVNTGKTRFGAEYEEKRFFSDYKEKDGIMTANKINVEKTSLTKTGKFEINDELALKSIKFNPTFKPNIFEVKK